ncbi:MAG: phage major capsid protein [Pirellulaceae bacterium]|nr:phage major capsid protein [Pirellulaceae bacterium]
MVEASLSSDSPVDRDGYSEILDHAADSVDLERARDGLPLLLHHNPESVVGVVEGIKVIGNKLRGLLRFGKGRLANEVWEDVKGGILRNVSIGYSILATEPDGETVRVKRWKPLEASLVSIPADASVGIGRSITMEKVETAATESGKTERRSENSRVREILALGRIHDCRDEAETAVTEGTPLDAFRGNMLERYSSATKPIYQPADGEWAAREFSLSKLIAHEIDNSVDAGYEIEVSQELARRSGKSPKGRYIPSSAMATRTTLTSSNTGNWIGTEHRPDQFIELLRPESAVIAAGARVLSGLQQDVSIPKITGGSSASFVAEGSAASESTPTVGAVTLSPKHMSARVSYSRQLLLQGLPDVEMTLTGDLRQQLGTKLDEVAIEGGGTNEPTGIMQTSGVGSVALGTNGAAPDLAMLANLIKEIGVDNALAGRLAYLTNSKVVSKLRQTAKVSSTDSVMLINEVMSIFGYNVIESNNVPSDLTKGSGSSLSAMIFGNFNDLLIGEFGPIDVIVDPYTNADTGNVRVIAHMAVDVAVRHAESFAICTDIVTT